MSWIKIQTRGKATRSWIGKRDFPVEWSFVVGRDLYERTSEKHKRSSIAETKTSVYGVVKNEANNEAKQSKIKR